jgi:phospholipase/lecithinase/hemolysin
MNRVRHSIAAIALASLAGPTAGIAGVPFDETFDRIVGFGDSLSDIRAVYAAGARSFVVPNMPNLAITPVVRSLGGEAAAGATVLSAARNTELNDVLEQLEAALPNVESLRLDVSALLGSVVLHPEIYDLTDSLTPCLRFETIEHAVCAEPDRHLFWDGLHPTAAAHGILTQAAYALLTASRPANASD